MITMVDDFYCPSCKKWISRTLDSMGQRVLRERCEKAGRIVKMRRKVKKASS